MAVKVHWFQIEPNLKEYEYQFTGLSTDEKPQDERVAANSLFLELDTGDFYYLKQAASSSTETLLSETITTYVTPDFPFYSPEYDVKIDADTINVVFDGVSYTVRSQLLNGGYMYGDFEEGEVVVPDFSRYPFLIGSFENDGKWTTVIAVETNIAHTVEITEINTIEAVWEKVGSGSQSDGYEINNPTLTMYVDNSAGISTEYFNIYFVNDDGYFSLSEKGVSAGSGSEEKTLVIGRLEDDDIDYSYMFHDKPYQVSEETNCEYDSGESVIRITDPTEDASIALTYGGIN